MAVVSVRHPWICSRCYGAIVEIVMLLLLLLAFTHSCNNPFFLVTALIQNWSKVNDEFCLFACPALTFTLQTFTTTVAYGGTDANVYVTLISKTGVSSPKIQLTNSTTFPANPFEAGHQDVFTVTAPNNGPIGSIKQVDSNFIEWGSPERLSPHTTSHILWFSDWLHRNTSAVSIIMLPIRLPENIIIWEVEYGRMFGGASTSGRW